MPEKDYEKDKRKNDQVIVEVNGKSYDLTKIYSCPCENTLYEQYLEKNKYSIDDPVEDLQKKIDTSIIFITHDLGVVANVADRVAVMYGGKIVEIGTVDEIFYNPQHPYTWGLLSSMPSLDTEDAKLYAIPGTPPDLLDPPKGDAFALRSEYALKIDMEQNPPFFKVSDTHSAATWLLHPDAPQVEPPLTVIERMKKFPGSRYYEGGAV